MANNTNNINTNDNNDNNTNNIRFKDINDIDWEVYGQLMLERAQKDSVYTDSL